MNSKATAAGVAALISKAQQLYRQSDVLIKQAQEECKHLNVSKHSYVSKAKGYPDQQQTACGCSDCGKRWVE